MLGSSYPEVIFKKVALKNFAKFRSENLCQSLFSKKVTGCLQIFAKFSGAIFLAGHLQTPTSECSLFYDLSEKETLF